MNKYFIIFILLIGYAFAGNYPLDIIAPRTYGADSLLSHYYKTYPGIEYRVPVRAFGGDYPFSYRLLTNPSGMTIDSTKGIITWPNPLTEGSPHHVSVEVSDSGATEKDTVSWSITVTTSDFIFVDASAGTGGDGSIGSPLDSLKDIYNASYSGKFVIFRGGTYDLTGLTLINAGTQQEKVDWDNGDAPVKWIGYPGETVVIDHDIYSDGAYFSMSDEACNYLWMQNIIFRDMKNHAIRIGGDYMVWFECEFRNGGPGVDGDNSSFIMYVSTGGTGDHNYNVISNCVMDSVSGTWSYTKLYDTDYMVIEQNKLSNAASAGEGHALKAYNTHCVIQADTIDNVRKHAINGNWNASANNEIRFNLILNSNNNYSSDNYGALTVNYHNTAGVHYIYRNTLEGTVTITNTSEGTGPFNFRDNVIVNENAGAEGFPHINIINAGDNSTVTINGNITGYGSDNIIDADGNLQGEYETLYLGTKGYQTTVAEESGSGSSKKVVTIDRIED